MEFEKFVQENHKENINLYSNISACSIQKISHRSLSRIEKEMGLKKGNAEQFFRECLEMNSGVVLKLNSSLFSPKGIL